MDCRICYEDKIEQTNILHLKCGHTLCFSCFDRLIKSQCPYCRDNIDDKIEKSYEFETENVSYTYDYSIEIDNILPLSELYYIEDEFNEEYSYDIIQYNRKKKKKNYNRKSFVSNNNRETFQRKKKKWKKKRNNHN